MHDDAIAVVGLACRLPGADDARAFRANLVAGRDTVSRFTREELLAAGVAPRLVARPDFVAARGVVAGADRFDRAFFGYSQGEARGIDPQQRVFLECATTALDDAAIDPWRFTGPIGVFAGCDAVPLGASQEELMAQTLGRDKDFLATRTAYKLRLTGPALTVQTACSTSLVAVHQAVQSLLGYECDAALAGGVGLFFPAVTGFVYQEGGILSPDGHCRPFDAEAGGTVSSSGAGVVVLRRLEDALNDGDRVLAVIRGTAVNNDGGDKVGFTAPSVSGQRDVILAALARADADPADIAYVEAHGTGTPLGDPVEVAALTEAFRSGDAAPGGCVLGAVKGNIGHTGSASGVSGLIKTVLMLHHREIVPTAHFRRPNPLLKLETTPFTVADRHTPWPTGRPLLAGVSSFGVGGTNAHAVLEAAPAVPAPPAGGATRGVRLLALSAASPSALRRSRTELAERLLEEDPPDLDEVARTLADGRRRHPFRTTVVARDIPGAAAELAAPAEKVAAASATGAPGTVAFVYPGQGTLRPGTIVAGAHDLLPEFAEAFEEVGAWARQRADTDLNPLLGRETSQEWFHDPVHQQLGLFAVGHALTRTLRSWGIEPAAVLGNSVGEYLAAFAAGVWELPDVLHLLTVRARAMRTAPPGRMLAVELLGDDDRQAVEEALAKTPGTVVAIDGHDRLVLSGTEDAVHRVRLLLTDRTTRLLETRRAFHSPHMEPAAAALRTAFERVPAAPPTIPVVSNLTGECATTGELLSADYWAAQLRSTVRLGAGMDTLLSQGVSVCVELGPGGTMAGALRRCSRWDADRHTAISLLDARGQDAQAEVVRALGRLWQAGPSVDVGRFAGRSKRRCALPPHPLDSRPCGTGTDVGASPAPAAGAHPPERRPSGPTARQIAAGLETAPTARPTLSSRPGHVEALDRYAAGLSARLVLRLGGMGAGASVARAELVARVAGQAAPERHAVLLIEAAIRHGLLIADDEGGVKAPEDIGTRLSSALSDTAELTDVMGVRRMLDHCADAYPEVAAGRRQAVSVLYPDGTDAFLRACLTGNAIDVSDAGSCLDQLADAVRAARDLSAARPLRVLEVGAGSGEMTGRVMSAWPADPRDAYTFTDISGAALARAREQDWPQLTVARLDLARDPVAQGFAPGGFDVVLAYNALHVTPDPRTTLRHLRHLLSDDGWLGAVEVTSVALWTHFIWGLAPGWWDFADDLRTDSAHLSAEQWQHALAEAGFTDVVLRGQEQADHALLLASPGCGSADPAPAPAEETAAPRTGTVAAVEPFGGGSPIARVWTQLLGTHGVRDEDDFFALGGDSLMAVRLRGRLHEELGRAVPLEAFLAEPTYGRLVALAEKAGDTAPTPSAPLLDKLLTFGADGPGTPLFLAAPATGSSLCYREVARALGGERPVHGIDAPGLMTGAAPASRIEDLAAHHLRVMRAVRPHGPYAVGGWSVGGLVAHEMAAQLERAGERVELLLLLDGFAPETGGRPLGAVPQHLAAGLGHQALITLRIGPAGRASRSIPGTNQVFRAALRGMLRYRPRPVSCPTLLFKTGLTPRTARHLKESLAPLHPAGLRVLPCSGKHWSMLHAPHAEGLSHRLRHELRCLPPSRAT